jgi:ElaB/YqjD/DUF883 family membrane-anchored ribosome-binding protein
MATTRDRLRKQARKVTKDLHKMANIAGNGVRKNFRQLRTNSSQRFEQGRDKVYQFERKAVQIIRDRPFWSALIGASVGLVFGRFLFRRYRADRRRTDDTT